MVEQYPMPRSPSQSFIPVVTPRPSRASISNAFPVSQASLAPQQPRRTSESSTQASPTSTSVSLGPQTPVSTMSSFRSFRNLLPFGPSKSSNAGAASPVNNAQKPYFGPFGSLRRSVTNERKTSATLNRPDESDTFPVIAIARSSENFEEEMMAHKRSRDLVRSSSDVGPSSPVREESYVLPAPSPGPPLGADLSTIIEAENSGISKHIPCLDDSTHPDESITPPTSPFQLERIDKSRMPSPDSRDASMLDLSTSKLNAEVMDALMVKDATTASEWLKGVNGVVVEESTDDSPSQSLGMQSTILAGGKNGEKSLDLGALDPDLAELLSPHRVNGKSHISSTLDGLRPSRTHSRSPSHPVVPSPRSITTERDVVSQEAPSPRIGSVIPPSPVSRAVAQSSPTRRTVSLSRTNLVRPPASSLPRLMRSVTTAPVPATESSPEESSGLRGPQIKRHQPPSPLSSQPHSSPPSSRGFSDLSVRRPATSRLATPNRHVSSYTPSTSRQADPPNALIPPDSGSASPVSQGSSRTASDHRRQPASQPSLDFGGPFEVNRRRRAHLFFNRSRSMSVEEARPSPASASTSSGPSPIRPSSSLSNRPPAMEWLGPRTVKAFAAAGLLDGDREGASTPSAGASRYASLRANNEREERYVPSRAGFSEVASSTSWGRSGSVSRVMTPSESGVTWAGSPTFSVPRTTFSGGSTAATSISASSSAQQAGAATMQLMKEKHDLETEALLSALSDSQRTTKTLREENSQLRDRIHELEDEVEMMRDQIHRLASGIGPPRTTASSTSLSVSTRERTIISPTPSLATSRHQHQHQHHHPHTMQTHSHLPMVRQNASNGNTTSLRDPITLHARAESSTSSSSFDPPAPAPAPPRTRRRRASSTSSSVFPNLPHNMSMLMLEDTIHDDRATTFSIASVSPPSPSRGLPHQQRNGIAPAHGHHHSHSHHHPHPHPHPHQHHSHSHSNGNGHATHSSMSSSSTGDNISPTTANFSMTEIPGSPTSLQLRPEHELHLGDMASISLYGMSDEDAQSL